MVTLKLACTVSLWNSYGVVNQRFFSDPTLLKKILHEVHRKTSPNETVTEVLPQVLLRSNTTQKEMYTRCYRMKQLLLCACLEVTFDIIVIVVCNPPPPADRPIQCLSHLLIKST